MQKPYFHKTFQVFHRCVLVLQKSLLLQFLIGGVCFALLFPPFRTPDEASHFLAGLTNSSKILDGTPTYCGKGVTLPDQFAGTDDRIGSGSFKINSMPDACTDNWTYGWLLNYPSILIAKLVTSDGKYSPVQSLLLFYLARIINGILVIAVFGRAIALVSESGLRSGVMLLFSFTLSALFMQQSWSVTADVPVNLLALYLSLVLLYFPFMKSVDIIIFFILGIVACSSKPVIAPLVPTFLLLAVVLNEPPQSNWKGSLRSLAKNRFFILGTASSCLGIATGLLQIGAEKERGNQFIAGQMDFVKDHPWEVFGYLNSKLIEFASRANHFFNTSLGYFKLKIPPFISESFGKIAILFILLEVALLLASFISSFTNKSFKHPTLPSTIRIVLAAMLAFLTLYFCSLLPVFMMYLVWTPVGSPVVEGVQARYFYPMIFCLIAFMGALVSRLTHQSSLMPILTKQSTTQVSALEWSFVGVLMLVGLCYWMSLFHSIVLTYFSN